MSDLNAMLTWVFSTLAHSNYGSVPQWLLAGTAIGAAVVAFFQYRSSKLFQLLQFLETPAIRKSRNKLYRLKETTKEDQWWVRNQDLAKAASDICASYDIVWRVAKGKHRRFFRKHWAYSICWTHDALETSLKARRDEGDKNAYKGFDKLYCGAKPFDPRNNDKRRCWLMRKLRSRRKRT